MTDLLNAGWGRRDFGRKGSKGVLEFTYTRVPIRVDPDGEYLAWPEGEKRGSARKCGRTTVVSPWFGITIVLFSREGKIEEGEGEGKKKRKKKRHLKLYRAFLPLSVLDGDTSR